MIKRTVKEKRSLINFLASEGLSVSEAILVWELLHVHHVMAVEISTCPTWRLSGEPDGSVTAEKIP
jgi:hypothetical protein